MIKLSQNLGVQILHILINVLCRSSCITCTEISGESKFQMTLMRFHFSYDAAIKKKLPMLAAHRKAAQ